LNVVIPIKWDEIKLFKNKVFTKGLTFNPNVYDKKNI
jgi:hypothetical protein